MKIISTRRLKDLFAPVYSIYKIIAEDSNLKLYIMRKDKSFRLLQIYENALNDLGISIDTMKQIIEDITNQSADMEYLKFIEDINRKLSRFVEIAIEREVEINEERFIRLPFFTKLVGGELRAFRRKVHFYYTPEPNTFGFYEGGMLRKPSYRKAVIRHLSDNPVELLTEVLHTINQFLIREEIPTQMFTQRWYDEYQKLLFAEERDISLIDRARIEPQYIDYVFERILNAIPSHTGAIGRKKIASIEMFYPIYLTDLLSLLRDIDKYRVVSVLLNSGYFEIDEDGLVQFVSPTLREHLGV